MVLAVMRKLALAGGALVFLTGLTVIPSHKSDNQTSLCGSPGQWLSPDSRKVLEGPSLLDKLSGKRAVLLGETHDNADDHRWQLHTLAALHSRQPKLAIGLEMIPRRLQPVLDEWVAGKLGEPEFLERVQWQKVWGFDARLYLPLFHFARMHGLPMLASNVERSLVSRVEKEGWEAVPEAEREGMTRPAAPDAAYMKELREVYDHHPGPKSDAGFARFAEAQTVWDRAMAEVMAQYLKAHPDHQVVGILGAGHVRQGHGVAHQLSALGVEGTANLFTWDRDCAELKPGLADAVFIKAPERRDQPPPRLGIALSPHDQGVRIVEVMADSVAERAGLKADDILINAAGREIMGLEEVRTLVRRQAPGTWLPLKVRRGDRELELVAKFPAE